MAAGATMWPIDMFLDNNRNKAIVMILEIKGC